MSKGLGLRTFHEHLNRDNKDSWMSQTNPNYIFYSILISASSYSCRRNRFSEIFTKTPSNDVGNYPRFLLRFLACHKTVLIARGPFWTRPTVAKLFIHWDFIVITVVSPVRNMRIAGSCNTEAEMSRGFNVLPRFRKLLEFLVKVQLCGIVNLPTIHHRFVL